MDPQSSPFRQFRHGHDSAARPKDQAAPFWGAQARDAVPKDLWDRFATKHINDGIEWANDS